MKFVWSREAGELIGLGLLAGSMVFVGLEIRQSNVQARATAYQAIGIATAEFHRKFDDRLAMLAVESRDPDRIADWSTTDWERYFRNWTESLRLFETLLLQVEQEVLPEESLDRLGWGQTPDYAWGNPVFNCLWPDLRELMGESLRERFEVQMPQDRYDCSEIDQSIVRRTALSVR